MGKLPTKELGKGIGALLSRMNADSEEEEVKHVVKELSHTTANIPIAWIEANPHQPRTDFSPEALAELADSIKIHGLVQPITVRRLSEQKYQIIAGERRWRASQMAGLEEIPAYIRIANDQTMLEMALIENIQREQLNPIEVAITYQRLIDECKLTHDKLAERVSKDRSTVTNFLRLLTLAPDIQQSLKSKSISVGHAKALMGTNDIALQLSLLQQIREQQLSVRAVEELISQYKNAQAKPKAAAAPKLSASYQTVQDSLRNYFGKKVSLKVEADGKGSIVIPFQSTEDLNAVLEQLDL